MTPRGRACRPDSASPSGIGAAGYGTRSTTHSPVSGSSASSESDPDPGAIGAFGPSPSVSNWSTQRRSRCPRAMALSSGRGSMSCLGRTHRALLHVVGRDDRGRSGPGVYFQQRTDARTATAAKLPQHSEQPLRPEQPVGAAEKHTFRDFFPRPPENGGEPRLLGPDRPFWHRLFKIGLSRRHSGIRRSSRKWTRMPAP